MGSLFTFNQTVNNTQVLKEIKHLKTYLMASFEQIQEAFNALTQTITEERAEANAKLDELQSTINELNQNINEGGTVEQRDALLLNINTQIEEVRNIIPNTPPTV